MKAIVLTQINGLFEGVDFGRPFARVAAWLKVAAERRRLAGLPSHRLSDLGIDVAIANGEAGRPFWEIPSSRRDLN